MNHLTIKSIDVALPKNTVEFHSTRKNITTTSTRYRISEGENALSLMLEATIKAFAKTNYTLSDIDLIVSASAVSLQPIPCGAAVFKSHLQCHFNVDTDIPCFDINSTCSSFLTSLDTISYFLEGGKYKRVLLITCDTGSIGLNKNQRESYELFSDAAVTTILEHTTEQKGIIASHMTTDSKGVATTQIRGGGTILPPYQYSKDTHEDYLFDMNGPQTLRVTKKALEKFIPQLLSNAKMTSSDFDYIIPHQASSALKLMIRHLKLDVDKCLDIVQDYGNMVSASVPFGLHYAIDNNLVKEGDKILLLGTAAGITINGIVLQL